MNRGDVPPDDRVEGLIRAYLDAQVTPVEALRMLKRARAPRARVRRSRWFVGLAAGLLGLVVFWGLGSTKGLIKADVLVREAREAHSRGLDRHYRSTATIRPEALAFHPNLKQIEGFHSDLWTRGDRFHVRARGPGGSFDWGREQGGRTWVAATDRIGLVFEPGEVPDALTVASELLSLDADEVLGEMLTGFDLLEEPADPSDGPGVVRIRATPRAGRAHPRLVSATLDIDARSKVVRRMTMARGPRGRAAVDVAFTLVDSDAEPDPAYTLEGHLGPGAEVFDRDRPGRRRQVLVRHLGFLTRVLAEIREATPRSAPGDGN